MFLRLALMWGTAAQQCRKEASTETLAQPNLRQTNILRNAEWQVRVGARSDRVESSSPDGI
jgi:hypothetical protein